MEHKFPPRQNATPQQLAGLIAAQNQALAVRQFTEESSGKPCPETPQLMTHEEAKFIVRMVLSEMCELLETVCDTPQEAHAELIEAAKNTDVHTEKIALSADPDRARLELIAQQADSLVDANYYMLNSAAKKGWNLHNIFALVHGANMAKRFPDGTFHCREDGKVIKPPGWQEPDIVEEIRLQTKHGSFA